MIRLPTQGPREKGSDEGSQESQTNGFQLFDYVDGKVVICEQIYLDLRN